jgi:uncharacterized membrane protein YeaQ/YmgE (transglycosylase-associated protein family)
VGNKVGSTKSKYGIPYKTDFQIGEKMNIIIYLIAAAIVGWLASEIMHDRASLLINIVVGIVGAFIAGWFLSPLLGVGSINDAITIPTMLVSLLGAIILIAIVHLVRRRV